MQRRVTTEGERFGAGHVVLAAGAFSLQIEGLALALPVRPIRGQMVALSNDNARVRHVLRSERGYLVPREEASPQRIVAGSTLEDAGFEKRVTPRRIGTDFFRRIAGTGSRTRRCGSARNMVRLAARHARPSPSAGPGRTGRTDSCDRPLPQRHFAGADHG